MYPEYRPRRLRRSEALRAMVRETELSVKHLVYPLFIAPGTSIKDPIGAMPGCFHLSVDTAVEEAKEVFDLGVPAVILFGLPEHKDARGTEAWARVGERCETDKRVAWSPGRSVAGSRVSPGVSYCPEQERQTSVPCLPRDLLWCRCGAISNSTTRSAVKVLVRRVGLGGIEPPTSALSVLRSNRLSYSPVCYTERKDYTKRRPQPQRAYQARSWRP